MANESSPAKTDMSNTANIGVVIDKPTLKKLDWIAKRENRARSAQIRIFLAECIANYEKERRQK